MTVLRVSAWELGRSPVSDACAGGLEDPYGLIVIAAFEAGLARLDA